MVSPRATTAGAITKAIVQAVTIANIIGRRAGPQILERLDIIKDSYIQAEQNRSHCTG